MSVLHGARSHQPGRLMSGFAFWTITLMHDNPLLPLFKDPYERLREAGLKPGQKVLEVGCGPGFFTIPAAEMVGEGGLVYAVDINPLAVKRVRRKVEKEEIKNVEALERSGSDTGLPDGSIDLAFFFGTPHLYGGVEGVISEMGRVIKPGGTLSFQKVWRSEEELMALIEGAGFRYSERRGRIYLFKKA